MNYSLDGLLGEQEAEKAKSKSEEKENLVLVDMDNLQIRSLMVAWDPLDSMLANWKRSVLFSIKGLKRRFKNSDFVFAIDSKDPWRRDLFAEYKAHRQSIKDKSIIDWKLYYKVKGEFMPALENIYFNAAFIKIDRVEADDIIACIAADSHSRKYKNVIIISTDADYIQLYKYPNVKIWDPIKKDYKAALNHEDRLKEKIIIGDKADNIPAISPKTGPVKARKYLDDFSLISEDPVLWKNYLLNESLVSFEKIPEWVRNSIDTEYELGHLKFSKEADEDEIYKIVSKHLPEYILDWQQFL